MRCNPQQDSPDSNECHANDLVEVNPVPARQVHHDGVPTVRVEPDDKSARDDRQYSEHPPQG